MLRSRQVSVLASAAKAWQDAAIDGDRDPSAKRPSRRTRPPNLFHLQRQTLRADHVPSRIRARLADGGELILAPALWCRGPPDRIAAMVDAVASATGLNGPSGKEAAVQRRCRRN
jgi:hypothetical protein